MFTIERNVWKFQLELGDSVCVAVTCIKFARHCWFESRTVLDRMSIAGLESQYKAIQVCLNANESQQRKDTIICKETHT